MTLFPAFGPDAWALRLDCPWRTERPDAFPLAEPRRVASATLGSSANCLRNFRILQTVDLRTSARRIQTGRKVFVRTHSRSIRICSARRNPQPLINYPQLYLHGLSEGDFDLALRGLLGDDAPVSAATVARLKDKWNIELSQWRSRRLDDLEVVYIWVDGVYVKAGLEREKAAVLVVIAALSDGSKQVLRADPGYRESVESWSETLRSIRSRGMNCPRLVVGDGHLGIWGALRNVYPESDEQRCWNHKLLNVLDRLPKRDQAQAKMMLKRIPYAETKRESERLRKLFSQWCAERGHESASETLERDWERMVAFYDYPWEHWQHLRTTNPVESPFASLRLRTDAAKRYKRVDRAIAVIWKMLVVVEQRFRRLNAPELMKDVYSGEKYEDGVAIQTTEEAAA